MTWPSIRPPVGFDPIKRTDDARWFKLPAHRLVVERTFAWPDWCRRSSKDSKVPPRTTGAMNRLAMNCGLTKKLASWTRSRSGEIRIGRSLAS